MSYAGARAQLATMLAAASWTPPATCAGIGALQRTAFATGAIFKTHEFPDPLKPDIFPVATIYIAPIDEQRTTSGSDPISQKLQTIVPSIGIYMNVKKENLGPGQDYFDAVMDGVLSYLRQHSGGGGTPTTGNNDLLTSSALRQRSNQERPVLDGAWWKFRGVIQPTLQMSIV